MVLQVFPDGTIHMLETRRLTGQDPLSLNKTLCFPPTPKHKFSFTVLL